VDKYYKWVAVVCNAGRWGVTKCGWHPWKLDELEKAVLNFRHSHFCRTIAVVSEESEEGCGEAANWMATIVIGDRHVALGS
jgi:hypothetical protein